MRSRRGASKSSESESSAAAQAAAFDDARALALEISRGIPSRHFDAMAAGLVLGSSEIAYRWIGAWLAAQDGGSWAAPNWAQILITDQRLLCRCDDGHLLPLPWDGVTGLQIVLDEHYLVLNYGGQAPIILFGDASAAIAVTAVSTLYGVGSLLTHPALARLRSA